MSIKKFARGAVAKREKIKRGEAGLRETVKLWLGMLDVDGYGVEDKILFAAMSDHSEVEIDDMLSELAWEGLVYQPRPDYYKLMD